MCVCARAHARVLIGGTNLNVHDLFHLCLPGLTTVATTTTATTHTTRTTADTLARADTRYRLGAVGTDACPAGTVQVPPWECEAAVGAMRPDEVDRARPLQVDKFVGRSLWIGIGCSTESGGDWAAYFDTATVAELGAQKVHTRHQPVCKTVATSARAASTTSTTAAHTTMSTSTDNNLVLDLNHEHDRSQLLRLC